MKNDFNNIDNLFKQGLGGYTEVPPPDVWDALDRRLDNDKKKRPFAGWRWFFVMLCCVGLFGSLYAWKLSGTQQEIAEGFRSGDIASIQQTAGNDNQKSTVQSNTSAEQNNETTTITHKKHRKNIHAETTTSVTNTNNTTEPTNTPPTATTNTTGNHSNVMDKSALAMAGNDAAAGRPANNKEGAIQYIVSNKSRSNVVVAQIDDSEPEYAGNNYSSSINADATDEENVTFGKRPSAANNEPTHRQPSTSVTAARTAVAVNKHTRTRITRNNNTGKNTTVTSSYGTVATVKPAKNQSYSKPAVATKTTSGTNNSVDNKTTTSSTATTQPSVAVKTTTPDTKGNAAEKSTIKTTPIKTAQNVVPTTPVATTTKQTTKQTTVAATTANNQPTKNADQQLAATKNTAKTSVEPTTKPATIAKATTTIAKREKKIAIAKVTTAHKNVVTTKQSVAVAKLPLGTAANSKSATATTPVLKTEKAVGKTEKKNNKAIKPTGTDVPAVAVINKPAAIVPGKKPAPQPIVATTTKNKKATNNKKEGKPTLNTTTAIVWLMQQSEEMPVPDAALLLANKIPRTFNDLPTSAIKYKPADTIPLPAPSADVANNDSNKKFRLGGYTYGVKAGYEGGFNNAASNKLVIAPFIERQISSKFSLMLQPAIKYANARTNGLSGTQTFYKTDPNGTVTNIDSFLIPVIQNNQTTGYLVRINVAYEEKHDSIVKSYSTGGRYMEFELPIMLKYAINPKLSVYGGVSLNYSKFVAIKENTFTAKNISVSDTTFTIYPTAPQPISSVLQYAGANINTYSGPLYPTQTGGLFRLGYMLGFSYEMKKRWLVDAMIQKGSAKTNMQGGLDVNKPLSTTYFRFTLGYRLSK